MTAPYLLMADDNRGDFELLQEALCVVHMGSDLRLVHVCDGQKAWDVLSAIPTGDAMPRLVVMDLHLPHITGVDVVARMKKSAHLSSIPSIIISSGGVPLQDRWCADAVFEKPGTWPEYLRFARTLSDRYLSMNQFAATDASS